MIPAELLGKTGVFLKVFAALFCSSEGRFSLTAVGDFLLSFLA